MKNIMKAEQSIADHGNVADRQNILADIDRAPLVSALLHGAPESPEAIEQLVRNEARRQGIDLPRETQSRFSYVRFFKPLFDRTAAAAALVLILPVFVLIILAIKLTSRGPAFFVQERTGYLGRRFPLYKFRTMVENAEELKESLQAQNIFEEGSPDFKLKNDPRVTKIGGFLRKSSLDELPNLINILRGDMSLVGPRPTSFKALTYRVNHLTRLTATPGLTGLWQVSGRADVDFDERVALDVEYIEEISLSKDIQILWRTVAAVQDREGAY